MKTKTKMALTVTVSLLIMLMTSFNSSGQQHKFLRGYQYLVSTNHDTPFNYTRVYSGSGDEFVTTYTIYHPTEGYASIIITATHFKTEKKVVVKIADAGGGIFSEINEEETTYETASLSPFGISGAVKALGGSRVPNQLKLKFASNKFENVKVVHVAGSHEHNDFEFFILDEQ